MRTSECRKAIGYLLQELTIIRERDIKEQDSRHQEASLLNNVGEAFSQLGEYKWAIDFYRQALSIARTVGLAQAEATSFTGLGNAFTQIGSDYAQMGEHEKAIDFHQQALTIAKAIGFRQGEALSLDSVGIAYSCLGDYEKAIDFHQQALVMAKAIGYRQGEVCSTGNLGAAYNGAGKYEKAIKWLTAALAIDREIGNRQGEAASLGGLSTAYKGLEKYQQAIDWQQKSLAIKQEIGTPQDKAVSLSKLGRLCRQVSDYKQAIDCFHQALAIDKTIGNLAREGDSLGELGIVYLELGDYRRAIDFHQKSLEIAQAIGSLEKEGKLLGELGNVYIDLGEYKRAIDFHQKALNITGELNDRPGEAIALGELGSAYCRLGQYKQATDFIQQALAINKELKNRRDLLGNSLSKLGQVHNKLGEHERAIDCYHQALSIVRELNLLSEEAKVLTSLGIQHLSQQTAALAEEYLLDAISILEKLRTPQLSDKDQISLFETQIRTYRNLETALVLQKKYKTALEITERGRTPAFVRLLTKKSPTKDDNTNTENSPTFADIQRIAKVQNSTLVEYSISINASRNGLSLHIWIISPTGKFHFEPVVPVDDSLKAISALVKQSRSAMNVRGRRDLGPVIAVTEETNADAQATQELRQLYRLLIEPIKKWLPKDPEKRVIFIPQGDLFLVPFPALQDDSGSYLIEQHTILTAPSIQVLDLIQHRDSAAKPPEEEESIEILAVGNPLMPTVWNPKIGNSIQLSPLEGAEKEAKAIAKLFNTEALIGAQATEQSVKQQMQHAQIVHLATHGLLEYGMPKDSGIKDLPGALVFTPTETENGLLTATEIFNELTLQADLVVLSACDTGIGSITGDGVIGLSRALIAAGAPSVIVSLWSIPDAPTAELMTEFYRQRQKEFDKAQSLRQAMLTIMKTHSSPRDWAAFTLIGEAD